MKLCSGRKKEVVRFQTAEVDMSNMLFLLLLFMYFKKWIMVGFNLP